MADGKQQKCRNNCGTNIYVSDRSGKWLPYNWGTDNKHDCPNYKKGAIAGSGGASGVNPQVDVLSIVVRLDRIEELLEATLKNLGLFKTAKGEFKEDTTNFD